MTTTIRTRPLAWLAALCLALAAAGCSVQYVSQYDAETEQQITAVQKQVEGLLAKIERGIGTDAADYERYEDTYREIGVDANLLHTRARAIDNNSITAEQTELLVGWLGNLEALHEGGIDDPDIITVLRSQAQQIFVAMLRFELAKKRAFDPVAAEED